MTRVTRRYRFAASHRLHIGGLSEQQNVALYGKCNNPFGHGHDYTLDVSVSGSVDAVTGKMFTTEQLDRLVNSAVLKRFEHRNINTDLPEFENLVPTTENICLVLENLLSNAWRSDMPQSTSLAGLRVEETARNSFEIVRES